MNSEFKHLSLDSIRYSLVWEDSETLFQALQITEDDELLIITSAGCNVLNALLKRPKGVTAIDLNPNQNRLLELKKHLILHHDFETYITLSGFLVPNEVKKAFNELLKSLDDVEGDFWTDYFRNNPEGLITAGRLEKYIGSFLHTLPSQIQEDVKRLITFDSVESQFDFFIKNLDNGDFKTAFIEYFDDKNLSKGRDPKLLKYAEETGGVTFYNRLKKQLSTTLVKNNFYFRFFFFGPQQIPGQILPPCYQRENFELLKQQIHKLKIVESEAIDFLSSEQGKIFNKACLSNIFEYTSHDEFQLVCNVLSEKVSHHLQVVFWNLLNEQGGRVFRRPLGLELKEEKISSKSCFYFKNVMSLHFNPLSSIKKS